MPGIKENTNRYRNAREQWEELTRKVVAERVSGTQIGQQKAIELSFGDSFVTFNMMRDEIDKLTEITEARAEITSDNTDAMVESSWLAIFWVGVALIVVSVILALLISRLISRNLNEVAGRISDISEGEGDLTARIQVDSTDEIGELATGFNKFADKLAALISEVATAVISMEKETQIISATVIESKEVTDIQQAENDMVAAAVSEMSSTAREVAGNVNAVAEGIRAANSDAVNGHEAVNSTISEINLLESDLENTNAVVAKLQNTSSEIGLVLDVISGIAEQTNLLALNAAIEAARAGEQGRGFAVVADEVRSLAQRTQESTTEIRTVIESLQNSAGSAVDAMNTSSKRISGLVDMAASAGEALSQITGSMTLVSEMAELIAAATEQQSVTTEEVDKNVLRIRDMATKSSDLTEASNNSATMLNTISKNLSELIKRFKY